MRYLRRRRRTVLYELLRREYGVPCPAWTSMQAFRYAAFGPRRKWVKILQTRQSSLLELSGDLLWLTVADQPNVPSHNVMKRILGDGKLMTMYRSSLFPRLKELEIYEIPDPVYRASIPQREYQPVLIGLRKGSVLTRHNLDTGQMYNRINLGPSPTSTLAVNYVGDILVVKSQRLSVPDSSEHFYRFHTFQLHPFQHLTTFDIESSVFPSKEHREEFGRLRNAEIHDGLLLVMTEKSYSLMYNAEEIIKWCVAKQEKVDEALEVQPVNRVKVAPQLLFHTYAHLDILGLGACPWTYIRAVSDAVLEVRDMASGEVLGNGHVSWCDGGDHIAPDFLMFHPDDSSRVIHVRLQELRVLGIHTRQGKRVLEEEFTYPEKLDNSDTDEEPRYSRSGRLIRSTYKLDNSLNRALSFNVETDMRVLVILEAWRDRKFNFTKLEKLVFYDSFSYELLHQMKIGVLVEGAIETNRMSVSIDRDILNIVSHKGTQHTVLAFRLKEDFPKEEDEDEDEKDERERVRGRSQRLSSNRNDCGRRKRSQELESDDEWEADESPERTETTRKRRRGRRNSHGGSRDRQGGSRNREGGSSRNRRVENKGKRARRESSVSENEDSDEWIP